MHLKKTHSEQCIYVIEYYLHGDEKGESEEIM